MHDAGGAAAGLAGALEAEAGFGDVQSVGVGVGLGGRASQGQGFGDALGRGNAVRVVDLDGLLRLKLRAAGPQDLLDAAQLLRKHPEMLEQVRPVAEAYGQWERLESWLNDPRLR